MRIITTKWARASVCLCVLGLGLALSSCGGGNGTGSPTATSAALRGTAYGGRQPIVGSTVTVYEAGLTPGDGATQIGQAVTGPGGTFNIAAFNPVPAAGQIVYVVIQGGDAGGSFNGAIKLMTVAGAFGSAGFPSTVNINELTTVAATAVLQNQIGLLNCGTVTGNTTLTGDCVVIAGELGLARRAATVRNLVDVVGGQASVLPAAELDGTPITLTRQTLNSLGDILAACVNSAGGVAGDGSACGNLFQIAGPATDTLVAAFRIAFNPAVNSQGTALFALLAAPLVYTPALSAAPANWTVGGQRFVYVASYNNALRGISGFTIDPASGALTPVAGQPFFTGPNATSVTVDPSGRFAYVTNQELSNVSAYTIDPASGRLSPPIGNLVFDADISPQSVTVDPSGRFAYVTNVGPRNGTSTISAYTIDPTSGALSPITGSPFAAGNEPYSVTVDPSGHFAYVADRTDNAVAAYTIDPTSGALTPLAGSPFAAGTQPESVTVDPSGRFVYVANFASNDVSVYGIDPVLGALTPVAGSPFGVGTGPLSVTVDPSGQFAYVANNQDNNVSAYTIDPASGALSPVAGSPFATGSQPQSVTVDPSGKFVYVAEAGGTIVNLSAYTIDPASGALTPVPGSPYFAGAGPVSVTVSP